jgi:hypothetical protein
MFVGHALLAFAIVATVGRVRGWSVRRALQVGLLAAAFATLPDVDMLYAPLGLLGGFAGAFAAADAFWSTANVVHRSVTHSLVVGGLAAAGVAAWHARGRRRIVGTGLLAVVVATAAVTSGAVGAAVALVFVAGGLLLVTVAARREVAPGTVFGAAAVGLLSHPFGDLLTGEPPALLYPFDVPLIAERVVVHPDPTMQFLAAFVLELAVIWTGLRVYAGLRGWSPRAHLRPTAVGGAAFGVAALALPSPTLEISYHFVFGVLATGLVTGPAAHPVRRPDVRTIVVSGLGAVTIAVATYTVAYALLLL